MIPKVTTMNEILEQALLYDFYGELLTAHQKDIYEQFVLDDLSLSEIAEMHAAAPDTTGAAMEVPLLTAYGCSPGCAYRLLQLMILVPGAKTSGFITHSSVGPRPE